MSRRTKASRRLETLANAVECVAPHSQGVVAREPVAPFMLERYVPAREVSILLKRGSADRQRRLAAADTISYVEAARLMKVSNTTMVAWILSGRAIGLRQARGGFRMPRWQFEPAVWAALPRLSAALGTIEGWALLSFLESPHGALEGRTPRWVIGEGHVDTVIEVAEQDGN